MSRQLDAIWSEKYRPTTIDGYVFQNDAHRLEVEQMIANQTVPHLLLSGVQGSGKTTLARILITALQLEDSDVMVINASDENNVETIRDKIKGFITTFAMGDFKVILLEEADYLTPNAQGILRTLMQDYTDTSRFIMTCNYDNKIMPAIKSRCTHYHFKASNIDDITEFVVKILLSEKIKFDLALVDKFVSAGYPDIRSIVNKMQKHVVDGVLTPPTTDGSVGDYKFEMIGLLEQDSWNDLRVLACANVLQDEWEEVYRFIYDNLHKAPKFTNKEKWEEGIIIIAEHLYKHALCSDPEINFAACAIRLIQA
jgi:replication factor C small subunit